ncbi:MAG: hypothetical protein ACR2RF_07230 [Geminicoccaceae bacterium]
MRMKSYILIALLVALPLAAAVMYWPKPSGPALEVLAISSGPEEIVREASPVTGTLVVGTLPADDSDEARLSPVVRLPASSKPKLCVHITSADGLYEWKAAYAVDQGKAGATALEYASKEPDVLAGYKADDLAIAAVMADDCLSELEEDAYVPAYWQGGQLVKEPESLSIAVQSGGKSTEIRWGKDRLNEHGACYRRSFDRDNVAYDTVCTVPIWRKGGSIKYRIELSEFGSRIETDEINIFY